MANAKTKILYITQEMSPYVALSEIADVSNKLPQYAQDSGMEIRVLMPRYGTINERTHRLHEVVRLSGMNIIVNDDDYPLFIKVASLPSARLQVYFLDNEEFFGRKSVFEDSHGHPFEDNIDRMIFFCKGAIETVRKFGWAPDLIHCHGWITSLVPLYVRTVCKNDPLFADSRIIYSLYSNPLEGVRSDAFLEKARANDLAAPDITAYCDIEKVKFDKGAIHYSDAVVIGSESLQTSVEGEADFNGKPLLHYHRYEQIKEGYLEFYQSLLQTV